MATQVVAHPAPTAVSQASAITHGSVGSDRGIFAVVDSNTESLAGGDVRHPMTICDGLQGVSIPALMKTVGLTHGGFYAHFSDRELVAEAIATAAAQTPPRWGRVRMMARVMAGMTKGHA